MDGNVIGPKILGNTTGLSPFWVIFAILLFGGSFGVIGMLFGVPMVLRYCTILSSVW
ncbi:MAG: AI-2E family transporter [Eubacterium ramulus]